MDKNSTEEIHIAASPTFSDKFNWPEYVVFAAILVASAAIGVFYGCFGSKQKSNEEYLMGNRKMSAFPVALSLLCRPQTLLAMVPFIPMTVVLLYFYVPVYFNLQLTSAYEYFELRFNRPLRIILSVICIVHLHIYMSLVVYGPSLALNQVTGLNRRMLSAVTFLVCIFYSTLGGFKTVLWTDALQGLVMMASLAAVVGKGIYDVGGFGVVLEKLTHGGRRDILNFDFDPRTRYTVWTSAFGTFFLWLLTYASTQANIQRFVSMPDMKTVRNSLLLNLLGLHIVIGLSYASGLAIYAKYHGCDPITLKVVSSADQILPYFVMDVLGDFPGMPGLFVGGLTCASLSTVSSALNALAAIITEDYIKKWNPYLSDSKLSQISKGICVTCGFISFGFLFVTEHLGNILPATLTISGIMMAPTLGLFTLGMFFPWANGKGALLGFIVAFAMMLSHGIGTILAKANQLLPDQRLPLSIDGCSSDFPIIFNSSTIPDWKNRDEDTFLIKILSISFNWIPFVSVTSVVILGILFSAIFSALGMSDKKKVSSKCLSPPMLWLWTKLCPGQIAELVNHDIYDPCKSELNVKQKY